MKFATAALLTLAHGIFAMPQAADKANDMAARDAEIHERDVCWKACFSEERNCPAGMYSSKMGTCWTCCSAPKGN